MDIFLKVVLLIFSVGLIAVVLLQKGKSAGLSGAISGGAEHLFGKTKSSWYGTRTTTCNSWTCCRILHYGDSSCCFH